MVLALLLAQSLRVPGIGLALALILLLQRESPGVTIRNILQIFSGAVLACIVCLVWVQLTDGTEVFRFIGFVLGVFVAGFCMAGTRLPLLFTIFGFYGFVDLASWDTHRAASSIVTSMLYNVASLGIALGMAGAVNYLLGSRHPREELHDELNKRLRLLADFHQERSQPGRRHGMTVLQHRVVQYADAGEEGLLKLYEELRSADPAHLPPGIRFRIGLLTSVLQQSSVSGFEPPAAHAAHRHIAQRCEHLLDARRPEPTPLAAHAPATLREMDTQLALYNEAELGAEREDTQPAAAKQSFRLFHSDAFQTPDAALYSLKLTLSATICYVLYNAIAWPGILTCVVTVLFTGLSSTGAMKQKQIYRLVGAAIGGVIAILVESLLFPNMDSITALILVAGCVCMLSAWVSRSPHIGYVGVQIAFAFFLTNLAGFSAADQIAPARDRVIGIALGIVVMWFVFDQLWPARPSDLLRAMLVRMHRNTSQAVMLTDPSERAAMRAEVSADLAQMQVLVQSAQFDFSANQHREQARTRQLTREITRAAAGFYKNLGSGLAQGTAGFKASDASQRSE